MKYLQRAVIVVVALAVATFVAGAEEPAYAQEPGPSPMDDDFDDNLLDPFKWIPHFRVGDSSDDPSAGTIQETEQRLEFTLKPSSSAIHRGVDVESRCTLGGDFDVQVDYELVSWPEDNKIRIGMLALGLQRQGGEAVERVSDSSQGGEVYLTHFSDGINKRPASGRSGKLRLSRTDESITGFFHNGDDFELLRTAVTNGSPATILLAMWVEDATPGGTVLFDNFQVNAGSVECPPALVPVDIKPGSDANFIGCNNDRGMIAVAILSTAEFDATTVDHTTVTFEAARETHVDRKSGEPRRHEEDVDGDGDPDLVFHFRLGDTDLTCDSTGGTLQGETFDGTRIEGNDSVRRVPPQ
jgi:hypothetical protein